MRTRYLIVCVVLAAAVMAAGCARKRSYVGPGGRVTVTEGRGKTKTVEINTQGGKAKIEVEKKTVTEAELGVPVYPGATAEASSSYEGSSGAQAEKVEHHMLTTPDDFDKVFAFYKARLKNVKNTVNNTMGDQKMAMFGLAGPGGAEISVQLVSDAEKKVTHIQVIKTQKGK